MRGSRFRGYLRAVGAAGRGWANAEKAVRRAIPATVSRELCFTRTLTWARRFFIPPPASSLTGVFLLTMQRLRRLLCALQTICRGRGACLLRDRVSDRRGRPVCLPAGTA